MLAGYQETWWQILLENLIPNAGMYVNREMIRNLSATLGQRAEETAKITEAQHASLNSLVQVVLDNRAALDVPLAKQGGICTIARTTCCVYLRRS